MPKLYTFGDSFTAGEGCRPGQEYYENYKKSNDQIWPELVANHYGIELINKGVGGCSNEIIMDNIIYEWNRIKSGDIVIIGKTYGHRFDIPEYPIKNKLVSVWGPSWFDSKLFAKWPYKDILKSYLLLFRHDTNLYNIRHSHYLNFFKNQLENTKNVTTIFWDTCTNILNVESITSATNGKIYDGHFSYQGHIDFSKWIINKIESHKTEKTNWI